MFSAVAVVSVLDHNYVTSCGMVRSSRLMSPQLVSLNTNLSGIINFTTVLFFKVLAVAYQQLRGACIRLILYSLFISNDESLSEQ